MDVGVGFQEVIWRELADDAHEQQTEADMPDAPKRRDVGGVKQLLRGKIPGIPG